jgi:hypothetical protein
MVEMIKNASSKVGLVSGSSKVQCMQKDGENTMM